MLVEFTVRNVLSFKERTTFHMCRNRAYKEHIDYIIDSSAKHLLKVASIYGANASGKTNLLIAIDRFTKIIQESMNAHDFNNRPVIAQNYLPFDFENGDDSSEFEVVIENDRYEYKYGFEYNEKKILSEWAYRKNLITNRTSILLHRKADTIQFGASVKRNCGIYHDQISDDVLVLTFMNKLKKHTAFHDLFDVLKKLLYIPPDLLNNLDFIVDILPSILDTQKENFVSFLNAIDVGIIDINMIEEHNERYFYTTHIGKDNEDYSLNLFSESEGTIRCIFLYIHIYYAIMNSTTIFIDELNEKLHPMLLKYIVDLFYNTDSQAQLIYTTHDISLLNSDCFRRDQIWFVEKDNYGYSSLKHLSDYSVRMDSSLYKNYINGKYGGIPHFSDFTFEDKTK